MMYFIAEDVCSKLGIQNKYRTFHDYGLAEDRDYFKLTKKKNRLLFEELISDPNKDSLIVFTVKAVFEILTKHRSYISEEANQLAERIKREIFNEPFDDSNIPEGYDHIKNAVKRLTSSQSDKFYSDEQFALNFAGDLFGKIDANTIKSVKMLRTFSDKRRKNNNPIEGINLNALAIHFKCFTI